MIPDKWMNHPNSKHSASHTICPNSTIQYKTPSEWTRQHLLYLEAYGHFFCTNQYRIERSDFDSYLFLLTLNGSGTVICGSEKKVCSRYDLVMVDCNLEHTYYSNEPWEFLWFHFNGNPAKELFSMIREKFGILIHVEGTQLWSHYFPLLAENSYGSTIADEVAVSSYLHRLLADLLSSDQLKTGQTQNQHLINAAIEYMEQNFHQPITLDQIADYLKVSKSGFCHTFRENTGHSPYDYLITTRINKAKYLLKTTAKSVSEISWDVGFNSSTNFIKTFRLKTGMTPHVFRKLDF